MRQISRPDPRSNTRWISAFPSPFVSTASTRFDEVEQSSCWSVSTRAVSADFAFPPAAPPPPPQPPRNNAALPASQILDPQGFFKRASLLALRKRTPTAARQYARAPRARKMPATAGHFGRPPQTTGAGATGEVPAAAQTPNGHRRRRKETETKREEGRRQNKARPGRPPLSQPERAPHLPR